VLAAENRKALLDHGRPVVHLAATAGVSFERVGLAKSRPVLALNPRATLVKLAEQRAPLYAEVATVVVNTDGIAPADVAQSVLEAIGRG
jgi:shikimate kinase